MKKHANDPELLVFRRSLGDPRAEAGLSIRRSLYLLRDAEFLIGHDRCEVLADYVGDTFVHQYAGDLDGDSLRAWRKMCDAIADYLQTVADAMSKEES